MVQLSLELFEGDEPEVALMLACVAAEETAKKAYGAQVDPQVRFTSLIRDGASVFGPMVAAGVDLRDSRLAVTTQSVTADPVPGLRARLPDLADVLYAVHRYGRGHAEELPQGFELVSDAEGFPGLVRLPEAPGKARVGPRTIFALLALAVLHPANRKGAKVPSDYHLDFGTDQYVINDWWGRYDEFYEEVINAGTACPCRTFIPSEDWIEEVAGPATRPTAE